MRLRVIIIALATLLPVGPVTAREHTDLIVLANGDRLPPQSKPVFKFLVNVRNSRCENRPVPDPGRV